MHIRNIENLGYYWNGTISFQDLMRRTEDIDRLYQDCIESYYHSASNDTIKKKLELIIFRLENNLIGRETKLS